MAALKQVLFLLCLLVFKTEAELLPRLPAGFDLGGQGSLLCGPAVRQPFGAVSAGNDTISCAISVSYVNLMGHMDAGPGGDFQSIAAGASWLRPSWRLQAGLRLFDALGIWREAELHLSAGPVLRRVALSLECDGGFVGIAGDRTRRDGTAGIGASVFFHGSRIITGISPSIPLTDDGDGGPSRLSRGRLEVHAAAVESPIGSPGVLLTLSDFEYPRFSLTVGERLRFGEHLAFECSLCSSPMRLGLGMTVTTGSLSTGIGGSRHPLLGWNGALAAEWVRK